MFASLAMICGVAVALLLFAEAKGRPRLRAASKLTAAAAFIGLALAGDALGSAVGCLILAGLVLCAAGDAFLLSARAGPFLAGMGAFAAGHAFYIAAFIAGGVRLGPGVCAASALALVFVGAFFLVMRSRLGAFLPFVAAYCAIISAMLIASFAHVAAEAPAGGVRALAAVGFALSDISVARDRFVRPDLSNRLWGLPLYFATQCLFAISV